MPTVYASESTPLFCSHTAGQSLRAAGLSEAQLDAVINAVKMASDGSFLSAKQLISTTLAAHDVEIDRKLALQMSETATRLTELKDELKTLQNADYRELEKEIDDVLSKIDVQLSDRDSSRRELAEQIDAKLERLENRILRFAFTTTVSAGTLGLAMWRLML